MKLGSVEIRLLWSDMLGHTQILAPRLVVLVSSVIGTLPVKIVSDGIFGDLQYVKRILSATSIMDPCNFFGVKVKVKD